jgi:DNA-binding response OmpR family regulator
MLTVLLAVRDDELRRTLAAMLDTVSDRVIVTSDQKQAASAMLAVSFDMLLMCGDSAEFGQDFAATCRIAQPHLVIMVAHNGDHHARMAGVDLYLKMPFTLNTLHRLMDLVERERHRPTPFDSIFNPRH